MNGAERYPYTVRDMAVAQLPGLRVTPGDFPPHVLVPGDPERAARIAARLEGSVALARNREFHSYRGTYKGVDVGVVSSGVGAPGAALCCEEAIRAGARVLLRVGTAGSLQDVVQDGDLVVATGAARCEGTTPWMLPAEWPAVADHGVVQALWEAAEEVGGRRHMGVVVTLDLFYRGVLDLGLDVWSNAGALAVEMECAALFCVAGLRGVRAGAILAVDGNAREASDGAYDPHREEVQEAVEREISAALHAVVLLSGREPRRG